MEEDVRIPVIVDIQDEGTADKLVSRLENLRTELNKIADARKRVTSSGEDARTGGGFPDAERIERSIRAIHRYIDAVKLTANEPGIEEKSKQATVYINKEIESINNIISRYSELNHMMSSAPDTKVFEPQISNLKELQQYIEEVNGQLETFTKFLQANPSNGNEVMEKSASNIEEVISNIGALTKDLGSLASEWSEVSKETDNAYKSFRDTSSYMRKQMVSMYRDGDFSEGIKAKDVEWVEKRKEAYDTAKLLDEAMASEASGTANRVKDSINEQMIALRELVQNYTAAIPSVDEHGNHLMRASKFVRENTEALNENTEAEKKNKSSKGDVNAEAIKHKREEIALIKQSTAQYYYKLRSLKMLTFVVNSATNALNNFGKVSVNVAKKSLNAYLRLIPGVTKLQKAISKTSATHKLFGKDVAASTKEHDKFNFSLKQAITSLLKYGLGIRSIFVLFNKLRSAISSGLGEMALQFDDVNENMSSILTSMNQMKAALTSIIEPIVAVLAPVLERIAAVVSDIAYKVASFIAALSGRSSVYKATRVQMNYAESLDKTAKKAKEAKKELSGLDKLNVINSEKDNDDSSSGKKPTMGWEKVPIDSKMADWAKKFKEFLDRLLGPIKKAWDKMKDFVKQSFKYMLDELLKLGKDVARDFWRVWEEPETQKIFENIFKIVGDIFLIVGNLAKKIREAWNYNENGYRILKAIRDIIGIIVQGVTDIADYMVIWSDNLTFVPLFDAIADVLEQQVVPAVQKVVDLFVYLTEEVLLELVRYVIEELAPKLVKAFGNIVEAIGNIAENILKALKNGDKGKKIVKQLETLITIVADGILEATEATKEWAKELNFDPLFEAILRFLEKIQPLVQFITDLVKRFWTEVILPFWKYLIEDGGPKLLDLLGKIFGEYDESTGLGIKYDELRKVLDKLLPALEKFFELAWETLLKLIEDLGKKFDDFVNSGALEKLVDGFAKWVEKADPEKLAHKIEIFISVFLALKSAFSLFSNVIFPVIVGFSTLRNFFLQKNMLKAVGRLTGEINTLKGAAEGAATASKGAATAAEATEAAAGSAAAGATAAGTAATAALGVFDAAIVAYDVGKLVQVHNDWEKADDEHETATKNYCDSITKLYNTAGQKAVNDYAGHEVDMEALYKQWETATGEDKVKLETTLAELNKVYSDAGNTAVSTVAGTNTTLGEEIAKAEKAYEDMPHNMWDGFVAGWDTYFGKDGAGLGKLASDAFSEMVTTIKDLLSIGSPSVVMKDIATDTVQGFENGLVFDNVMSTITTNITNIINSFTTKLNDNTLVSTAKSLLSGFNGSLDFSKILSTVTTGDNNIVKTFNNGLRPNTFKVMGINLINGLREGLMSALNSALQAVTNICNQIADTARRAFQIHSPSKVFEGIGQQLVSGLVVGVDEDADDVDESFKGMIPSPKLLDSFYAKFLEVMENLTDNTTAMFDAMFAHIEDTMAKLERMMALTDVMNTFNRLPEIKVPSIAVGQQLPATKSFTQATSEFDMSRLPEIIKDAVIEALEDTIDLRNDDETVIVNIDGKQVFKAVRNVNSEYKKQHGVSAFI